MNYFWKLFFICLLSFKTIDAYSESVDIDSDQDEEIFSNCVKDASRIEFEGEKLNKLHTRIKLVESAGGDASADIRTYNRDTQARNRTIEYFDRNCFQKNFSLSIEYIDSVCKHPASKSIFCDDILKRNSLGK